MYSILPINYVPLSRLRKKKDGFSLVEVVLAVGVISFSMISVIGVLPVGMSAMRSANDSTTQSQVAKQLSAKISMTGFSKLVTSFDNKTFLFNESGESQAADDPNTRFRATTSIVTAAFPGSDKASAGQVALTTQLTVVKVDLVTSASKNAKTKETMSFTVPVANYGG